MSLRQSGSEVKLTAYLHLVPRLSKSAAMTLLQSVPVCGARRQLQSNMCVQLRPFVFVFIRDFYLTYLTHDPYV